MERENIMETLYHLEVAWDTLYAMDKSINKNSYINERMYLLRTQTFLMEHYGISTDDMLAYNVLRRSRHTAIQMQKEGIQ